MQCEEGIWCREKGRGVSSVPVQVGSVSESAMLGVSVVEVWVSLASLFSESEPESEVSLSEGSSESSPLGDLSASKVALGLVDLSVREGKYSLTDFWEEGCFLLSGVSLRGETSAALFLPPLFLGGFVASEGFLLTVTQCSRVLT